MKLIDLPVIRPTASERIPHPTKWRIFITRTYYPIYAKAGNKNGIKVYRLKTIFFNRVKAERLIAKITAKGSINTHNWKMVKKLN
jgi:hypothetical protein